MTREREQFLALMLNEFGPDVSTNERIDVCRKLSRYAHTHHRLAEAQCNGDWPAENGERVVTPCAKCESQWVPSTLDKHGNCKSCRIEASIAKLCTEYGFAADFQGDPRGATVTIKVPSGRTTDWGKVGICVPC